MKLLKLSKTGWLILAAGVFVVVLGSLGITRTQQLQEKGKLDEDLRVSTQLLEKLQASDLSGQVDSLQQRVEEEEVLLKEAQERMDQTVVSVDVSDELFVIAEYCGVEIRTLSTTPIKPNNLYEGIGLDTTMLNVVAIGELENLVDFVISVNNDYTTGVIKSFQISLPDSASPQPPSVSIQITIYSYEGSSDGK